MAKETGLVEYSEIINGTRGNFNQKARFDWTDGFLGISQYDAEEIKRVLLSPKQVKEMLRFIREQGKGE